jgi:bacterioferritin
MVSDLNRHLGLELAAHLRYQGHANIIAFKGYGKLSEKYKAEAGEELGHADKVVYRIQQLEGFPDYQTVATVAPALEKWDILELLSSDLEVEKTVLDSLAGMIEQAEQSNDWETGNVLRELVSDTESHITWLDTQVRLLEELGKANYLQAQLG